MRKRNNGLLIKEEDLDASQVAPIITYKGEIMEESEFRVQAEGVVVGTTESMLDAFCLLLATYFVFNIVYPSILEGTLTFIKKCVVGHSDKVKIPFKVTTLLTRLSSV